MRSNKSDPLKALSDPLRISLFELIKEGEKTTLELADILNENRINLYHHLKVLEQAGLIMSSYNSSREKVFSTQSQNPEIIHQQQVTTIMPEPKDQPVETIILSPPSDEEAYEEFKNLTDKLATLSGKSLSSNREILQIQITTEEKKIYSIKRAKSASYMLSKMNKSEELD